MTSKTDATGTNLEDNAPPGLSITTSEAKAARHEGAKEAAKEIGKDAYKALTDGQLPGDPAVNQWHGSDEIEPWAYLLDTPVDELKKLITGKDSRIAENKVYGILALERNGRNRTDYVQMLMKRLGLKSDELPGGGSSYTNDTTNITEL